MVSRKETLKEIDKAKKRHILYMVLLVVIFCAGIGLLFIFISKNELPALLLCIVAWAWCALLIYQLTKTKELIALMNTHLERLDDALPAEEGEAETGATRHKGGEDGEP